MSAIALSCIAFVCISGGALLGMFLRNTLAGHHLSTDAKDVVRLGTGLIGTIAALVLGLLIASAKNSYDTQSTQIKQMTANIILLDNFLEQYGPETGAIRGAASLFWPIECGVRTIPILPRRPPSRRAPQVKHSI
jgi:hypothetical protein